MTENCNYFFAVHPGYAPRACPWQGQMLLLHQWTKCLQDPPPALNLYFVLLSVYTNSPWGAVLMGSVVSTHVVRTGFEPVLVTDLITWDSNPHHSSDAFTISPPDYFLVFPRCQYGYFVYNSGLSYCFLSWSQDRIRTYNEQPSLTDGFNTTSLYTPDLPVLP